jgi:hypothetical protein
MAGGPPMQKAGRLTTMQGLKLLLLTILMCLPFRYVHAGNYTLTVNGKSVELDIGTEQKLKLPDGRELTLKLDRKAANTFTDNGLSFQYPSQFNVATSKVSPGIYQHLMATALGTVILVQTYPDMDATTLIDFMTGKMTDDDVASGSVRDTKPHSRTLADGTVLTGTRSTLKRDNDDGVVEVLGARKGRGGVMLITRTDHYTAPDDGVIIEQFWSTLKIK